MNKTIIAGRIGTVPSARGNVVTFKVATTHKWRDKGSGQMNEETEWHPCVAFGKTGEYCLNHLKKGQPVVVEASIHYPKWTDKETGQPRSGVELRVQTINPTGPAPRDNAPGDNGQDADQDMAPAAEGFPSFEDENFSY